MEFRFGVAGGGALGRIFTSRLTNRNTMAGELMVGGGGDGHCEEIAKFGNAKCILHADILTSLNSGLST